MRSSERIHAVLTGTSPAMQRLKSDVAAVAPLESNVMITGETGTGKGRIARLLHDLSPRSGRPFVHVDCAALAAGLIESELFGHERGSFTSASHQYIGRFERAGRGTLFLDEVGDLAQPLQAKLLRVLEDREFERVGGVQTLRMEARVVAATSRDLHAAVEAGTFRADLFFRLGVFELEVPALRERAEDLAALARAALLRLCARAGARTPPMDAGFVAALRAHAWPGNVRELFNLIERVLAKSDGGALRADHVHEALGRTAAWGRPVAPGAAATLEGVREDVAELERREILAALASSGGNVAQAARRLRMPRGTLRHKLRKYALTDAPPASGSRGEDR